MKKFFNIFLLVGLFLSFSAVETNAQSVINNTNCDFVVAVAYADFACNNTGYEYVDVPANTTVPLSFPPGSRIVASKGYPISLGTSPGNCVYYIGRPNCVNYPTSTFVFCGSLQCGNYSASLDASFANITLQ